jgi:hypothetical protein
MDFSVLAERIASINIEAKRKKKQIEKPKRKRVSKPKADFTTPKTEYSAHIDLSIIIDFEGNVAKEALKKKIQNELISAIQNGMTIVAEEFDLQSTVARVKAVNMELAVNDQAAIEDEINTEAPEEE